MFNKNNSNKNNRPGFTIIEVIIVLVIAAIILVMVFLVVPQIQRAQRDSARRSYTSQILSATERLAGNAGGIYSGTTITEALIKGIIGVIRDPSSKSEITIFVNTTGTDDTTKYDTTGEVEVLLGFGCNRIPGTAPTSGSGKVAILTKLESGNYCISFP
jgi:prepilin-type N-terminal cleavage/methylation domain-containing protein